MKKLIGGIWLIVSIVMICHGLTTFGIINAILATGLLSSKSTPNNPNYRIAPHQKKRESITKYVYSDEYPKDFVVIDLETTGLDAEYDEIIQIAAISFKNCVEINRFMLMVKPTIPIPKQASEINHIYDSMVADSPNIHDALTRFVDFIGDSTLIAHNASFDLKFLQTFLTDCEMNTLTNPVIDTLSLARSFLNLPNYKLQTIKEHYNIDVQSHEALSDCIVCSKLYIDYLHYANPIYDDITDEAYKCFIDDSSEPISDTMRGIIEKACSEHGGRCYKSAAKSVKYVVIANEYQQNGNRVDYWHEKGYKVTTLERLMEYCNLIKSKEKH